MGTWDTTCILWKRNSRIFWDLKTKRPLQQHVKPKYKTTLVNEPGLYSLAMHSRSPRAEIFQDKIYSGNTTPSMRKVSANR